MMGGWAWGWMWLWPVLIVVGLLILGYLAVRLAQGRRASGPSLDRVSFGIFGGLSAVTGLMSAVEAYGPDQLWEITTPLIPPTPQRRQGGRRRRTPDRAVLAAIPYLTQAGCSWWQLPKTMFGVSRATAHRRFTEWTQAGLWERLHQAVLNRLGAAGDIDWSRAVVDSIAVRAEKRGP